MASVTITIPDLLVPRVRAAVEWRYGDTATPKSVMLDLLRSLVRDYEQKLAGEAAEAVARTAAVSDMEGVS